MRIDKEKFYQGTCRECKRLDNCQGREMYSCARMRMFRREAFDKYIGIKTDHLSKL